MSAFNLRAVALTSEPEAKAFLKRYIQPSPYGSNHMAGKSRTFCFLAEKVRDPATHILKETMLSIGGEVAVHRDTLINSAGTSSVLIIGTAVQLKALAEKLKLQQFGMKALSAELLTALAVVSAKTAHVIPYRGGELRFGERTLVMGILNVTPDSFSDGGRWSGVERAVEHALQMEADGADLIDVGAESTAPGNAPVDQKTECERLLPVLEALAGKLTVPISVDTYKAATARAALEAGAAVVNDVWGFQKDAEMARVVAEYRCPAIIMHNKEEAVYEDYFGEVLAFLRRSIALAEEAGCSREQLIVDPGFGFGKTAEHNLAITNKLEELQVLGCPVLMAASRKRTVGAILDAPANERLEGDIAIAVLSAAKGADMVRVHDVKPVVKALKVADAVLRQGYTC